MIKKIAIVLVVLFVGSMFYPYEYNTIKVSYKSVIENYPFQGKLVTKDTVFYVGSANAGKVWTYEGDTIQLYYKTNVYGWVLGDATE